MVSDIAVIRVLLLHCLCNKCTTLAKPCFFSWLRNSEAILYAVTLPNCGLESCALCCSYIQFTVVVLTTVADELERYTYDRLLWY